MEPIAVKVELDSSDYAIIQKALRFIAANLDDYNSMLEDTEDPPIEELALQNTMQKFGA